MSISYLIAALGVVAVFCSLNSVYSSRSHTAEGLAMLQDTVSSIEERIPSPKKGWQHYYRYLNKSYKIPKDAEKAGVSGKISISFVVEPDGTISDVEAVEDLGYGTGEEGVRVIQEGPKWNPGIKDGKAVRVKFTAPIAISAPAPKPSKKSD